MQGLAGIGMLLLRPVTGVRHRGRTPWLRLKR